MELFLEAMPLLEIKPELDVAKLCFSKVYLKLTLTVERMTFVLVLLLVEVRAHHLPDIY